MRADKKNNFDMCPQRFDTFGGAYFYGKKEQYSKNIVLNLNWCLD